MYGGDEVSAIVVDLGSHTCKAGYAGEDAPKAVFPSIVGSSIDQMEVDNHDNPDNNSGSVPDSKSKSKGVLYVGSQALGFRRDYMEVLPSIKDGIVADWEIVENIWDHAFRECLLIDPKEHPMLLAEPCSNTQQQREKAAELMFEKYQVPALFLAKNPLNLVRDCDQVCDATWLVVFLLMPVVEGRLQLLLCMMDMFFKGYFLLTCINAFDRGCLLTEHMEDSSYSNIPMTSYELPDGQTIEIGADRFKIPDILFNPSLVRTIPGMESFAESAASLRSLPQLVIESINRSDVDIRRELYSSILLAGGTASMQQLKERLEKDLLEESPQAARVKVLASGNATERRFSFGSSGSTVISPGAGTAIPAMHHSFV
nr:actin-related protein 4-like [Ipomoea batatas]